MKTLKKVEIQPIWIDNIPELKDMEENKLYISNEYYTASHRCLCGCGNEVITPLNHGSHTLGWTITLNFGKVSLYPSILNKLCPNRSHYILTKNVANFV